MRLTVVIDVGVPDDEKGRQTVALYLYLLSVGRNRFIAIDAKEGDIRDLDGNAVGHWKIDP
jgi:hypothetical protein